jgi:cyclic pyranopterin phosphate synthase
VSTDPDVGMAGLPHLNESGQARMVDVSAKPVSARTATAPDLIPLCHPLSISGVDVVAEVTDAGVALSATVKTTDRTGVEMEALTAVSVAALAVVDMIKALDRDAVITDIRVLAKSGGRRGDYRRAEDPA